MLKTKTTWARLVPIEKQALQAIMKKEQLNESEAVRFTIRFVAKMMKLWPTQCPDCNSLITDYIGGNNYRCECGHHFGV